MEFPGRTLQAGESVFSDWFSRGGDNAIFRAQLISAELSSGDVVGTATIKVFSKNSETQGDGSEIASAEITIADPNEVGDILEQLVISTAGTTVSTGILELLRYKVSVTGGWMRVNVFPPVFFDNAVTA